MYEYKTTPSLLQRLSQLIEPISYFHTNYTMVETVREFDSYAAASMAACAWVNSGKTKVNTKSLEPYEGYVLTTSLIIFLFWANVKITL